MEVAEPKRRAGVLKVEIEGWVPEIVMDAVGKRGVFAEGAGIGEVQLRDNVPAF